VLYRAPHGRAAWAGVYLKGLGGLSTRLAHCSGGACQRSCSAPSLQPSPATWPLSLLYAPRRRLWVQGDRDRLEQVIFGGLGLGLFISHSICKLHGGNLSLASAEGLGSIFTVTMPCMSLREGCCARGRTARTS
jgi:hypothetical protein